MTVLIVFSVQSVVKFCIAFGCVCRQNVGWASTCNTVGQTAGYFLGNVLFLALESADFCNNYLRWEPQPQGLVTLSSQSLILFADSVVVSQSLTHFAGYDSLTHYFTSFLLGIVHVPPLPPPPPLSVPSIIVCLALSCFRWSPPFSLSGWHMPVCSHLCSC